MNFLPFHNFSISFKAALNMISSVFDGKVGLGLPFWVSGKRDPNNGNRFHYDSGAPVVPSLTYIIRDDTMNRPIEECVTLKANYKSTNAYTANSAVCSHKKAVFCKIPKHLTSTTEAATTTAPISLSTTKPAIPGDNLPKMPRFCPPKRKKRNTISGK